MNRTIACHNLHYISLGLELGVKPLFEKGERRESSLFSLPKPIMCFFMWERFRKKLKKDRDMTKDEEGG
jgi:hypothetical protein